jgi:hypothetical protein
MQNTPRSNRVEMLTPHDALGATAIGLARTLERENGKLRDFIDMWRYDGRLQTFESREIFRKEAEALLGV